MNPTIQACWDWAKKRESDGINAPFDFFVYEDAYDKADQLLNGLDTYFVNDKSFHTAFYNAYLHYIITTDYRIKYEDVWPDRPLGQLDKLPMASLSPSSPIPQSVPMTTLTNATKHIPMTELNPSKESIPWTNVTPADNIAVPTESIPMTDFIPSIQTTGMEVVGDSQRWVINHLYVKYQIESQSVIYSSVSNGGSSTSVHIFSSLNDGDFLMADLIRTPYGKYVYQLLEQLQVIPVLL